MINETFRINSTSKDVFFKGPQREVTTSYDAVITSRVPNGRHFGSNPITKNNQN